MRFLLSLIALIIISQEHMIFQFSKSSKLTNWRIVNDGVMGGVSKSKLYLSKSGSGIFEGEVSLANNGGFAMTQYNCNLNAIHSFTTITLTLKGDGKQYQFRIKDNQRQYYSYVQNFKTTGSKQIIKLALNDFTPAFRGRQLNLSNFNADTIQQLGILIGNKKEESFRLELFSIALE